MLVWVVTQLRITCHNHRVGWVNHELLLNHAYHRSLLVCFACGGVCESVTGGRLSHMWQLAGQEGVSAHLSSMAQATQVMQQHHKYRVYTTVPVVYTMPVYKCHSAGH